MNQNYCARCNPIILMQTTDAGLVCPYHGKQYILEVHDDGEVAQELAGDEVQE